MTVAVWILLRRMRATERSLEAEEPSEGDRRTVTLPEEDAAQMFETLTALQEELERYRKPGVPAAAAARGAAVVEEVTPSMPEGEREVDPAKAFWDEEEDEHDEMPVRSESSAVPMEEAVTEKHERPETEPVEQVSAADRVLRSWLEDVERLARRARRDSL